jgi:hypothetical protein
MKQCIKISKSRKMMSDGKMKWVLKYPNGQVYTTTNSKRQIQNATDDLGCDLKIDSTL